MLARLRRLANGLNKVLDLLPYQEAMVLSALREEYRSIVALAKYDDTRRLTRFGFKAYSQADEDGIIEEIFARIGVTNRCFVELGCGNGLENNTHYLLLKKWHGLWIDGNETNVELIANRFAELLDAGQLAMKNAFLTTANVDELISEFVTGSTDLLSVDVDGNDFHLLKSIQSIAPRVIVVEYNAKKGRTLDWVMAYNPRHVWDRTDYYGASLKAYEILLRDRGYSLVGCSVSGVNAFFVRNDLVNDDLFLPPYTSETHYEPQRRLLRLGVETAFRSSFGDWTTAAEAVGVAERPPGAIDAVID